MADLSATNSRAVTVRLPELLYNHLVAQASLHDLSLAEAHRQALERDLDAQPGLKHEDGSPGESMSYRGFLQLADFSAAIAELHDQADSAEA